MHAHPPIIYQQLKKKQSGKDRDRWYGPDDFESSSSSSFPPPAPPHRQQHQNQHQSQQNHSPAKSSSSSRPWSGSGGGGGGGAGGGTVNGAPSKLPGGATSTPSKPAALQPIGSLAAFAEMSASTMNSSKKSMSAMAALLTGTNDDSKVIQFKIHQFSSVNSIQIHQFNSTRLNQLNSIQSSQSFIQLLKFHLL